MYDSDCTVLAKIIGKGRETKRLRNVSEQLLLEFGSLQAILNSDPIKLLKTVDLKTEEVAEILFYKNTIRAISKSEILGVPLDVNAPAFQNYCKLLLAHEKIEIAKLFYMDHNGFLVSEDCHQIGVHSSVHFLIRPTFKRAFDLKASGFIFVHNHPSGDPTPSETDLDIFRSLGRACRVMKMKFGGGLIVGNSSVFVADEFFVMGN